MSYDDWRAETQGRLLKSRIYLALKSRCQSDPAGLAVLTVVDDATFYAFQRTKIIVRNMGEFTLHDGDHLFRVLSLMEKLLTPAAIDALSIPELMLLILSAFFHDIGMAASEAEVSAWRKAWDSDVSFDGADEERQCMQFMRFCSSRPEQRDRIKLLYDQGRFSEADLAKDYLLSEYIRVTHAERAREIIKQDWLEKIRYRDTDLTVEFASICFSHNEDAASVLELDRQYLCGPDVYACLPLVAGILRLADLLDFDAKRTPTVLFSHLFVRHPVSIKEWNKHRAVEAWSIGPDAIQFHAKCGHPAVQAAINSFCDVIDQELSTCNNVFAALNEFHRTNGRNIVLRIPLKVDRTRIETKKNIDGQPEFIYRETQFNLSKTQVIDLLMGTKLYGDPEVALRELLQNSIDACLLREALEKAWGNSYTPEILVRYASEEGEDFLEVIDNGIGMDQHIVDNYYSRVGASFYKSAEFYDLRAQSRADFVPTSRFGIGILSSFMVADTMIVDTRKVYGPHESSESINLRIEGQESIFWIRAGERKTPGTSTRLVLRPEKHPWERMDDDEFIKSVENVIPNPPFKIRIESHSKSAVRDENSFLAINAASLKDYSWSTNKNIREVQIDLDDPNAGITGSAVIAILQKHGRPAKQVVMLSKSVDVDGESYDLGRSLSLNGKDISLASTSIEVDENGSVDSTSSSSRLCTSKSRLSLHGIEVPTTLFPDPWSMRKNQVVLAWPLPMLLVVDVSGSVDLDLNSSRTQVIMSEKWLRFEEALCYQVIARLSSKVGPRYWSSLRKILLGSTKNAVFAHTVSKL